MSEEQLDPKDVAAATGVGVAQRYGASRQRRGDEVAQGAAAGTARRRKKPSVRGLLWTMLFVAVAIVGTLAIMLNGSH